MKRSDALMIVSKSPKRLTRREALFLASLSPIRSPKRVNSPRPNSPASLPNKWKPTLSPIRNTPCNCKKCGRPVNPDSKRQKIMRLRIISKNMGLGRLPRRGTMARRIINQMSR